MNGNKIFYNPSGQKMMLNRDSVVFSSPSQAFIYARKEGGITISAQEDVELKGKNITLGSKEVGIKGKEAIEMVCGASSMIMDGSANETHFKALKVRKESPANIPISLPDADEIARMREQAELLNQFIEIIDGHPNQPYPEGYREALIDMFQSAVDPFWQRLFVDMINSDVINPRNSEGSADYNSITDWVNLDYNRDVNSNEGSGQIGRTYFHEMGHLIDFHIGRGPRRLARSLSSRNSGFYDTLESDFHAFLESQATDFLQNRNPDVPRSAEDILNPENWEAWGEYYESFYESVRQHIIRERGRLNELSDLSQYFSRVQLHRVNFREMQHATPYRIRYNGHTGYFRRDISRRSADRNYLGPPGYMFIDGGSGRWRNGRVDANYWSMYGASIFGVNMPAVEAFAHFFALMFNPSSLQRYRMYFPEAIAHFEAMVKAQRPDLLRNPHERTSLERVKDSMQDALNTVRREIRNSERSGARDEAEQMINPLTRTSLSIGAEEMRQVPGNIVLTTGGIFGSDGNYEQAVALTPDAIIIKCGNDTFIKLTAGQGIKVITDDKVLVKSANNISLISEDKVTIKGMEKVKLNSEAIKLDITSNKIELESEKIKIN